MPEEDASFFGEISGLDVAIGQLRSELKLLGISENTLVWFMSDNGGKRGDSRDPAGKGKGDIAARTTAVLEWPSVIKKPLIARVPVSHIDVYPTLLELAGLKVSAEPLIDGCSISALVRNDMPNRPKPLPFLRFSYPTNSLEFRNINFINDTQGILIDGKYELTVEPVLYPGSDPVRLFDIYEDPKQQNNLASKFPDVVTRMRAELEKWKESVRDSNKRKTLQTLGRKESREMGEHDD